MQSSKPQKTEVPGKGRANKSPKVHSSAPSPSKAGHEVTNTFKKPKKAGESVSVAMGSQPVTTKPGKPKENKVTIYTHDNRSFSVKNVKEKGNVDYIRNILAIIDTSLDFAIYVSENIEIGGFKDHLKVLGIPTASGSDFSELLSARNYLSHIDYAGKAIPLHKSVYVVELFKKAASFISALESKIGKGLSFEQEMLSTLEQTFQQHKMLRTAVSPVTIRLRSGESYLLDNPHYKTSRDNARVLTLMIGSCLSQCTVVSVAAAVKFTGMEQKALLGMDAYYWLKWGTMGYLTGKNQFNTSVFQTDFEFLIHQRLFLYHPVKCSHLGPLRVKDIFFKLKAIATALADDITLKNLDTLGPSLCNLQ